VKARERVLSRDSVLSGAHVWGLEGGTKELILRPFHTWRHPLFKAVSWCCTVIWIWKEPWVGVVWLFEFGKNRGLVLYGYLNLERTTGWCCMVIWNFKEPRVGVVWLFGFWKNHGLVLYSYLNFERTMGFIFFIIAESDNCPLRFFETSVKMKEPWVPAISKSLWLVKKGWS